MLGRPGRARGEQLIHQPSAADVRRMRMRY
jgi:hypothetical protein